MTETSAPFAPDWVSPPGETIVDLLDERGWTQSELSARLGYSPKHVNQLIKGKVPLSEDAAMRLERVLGGNAGFWLAREAKYREHCARLEAAQSHAGWVEWLEELPVKEMMSAGAIPKCRIDARNKPGIVEACLRFFGVATPEEWRDIYAGMQVSYRRSRTEQCDVGAISAWLRMGEQQAAVLDGPRYDKSRFEKALENIRELTCEPPEVFEPRMRELMHKAGVAFVLVPAIPRAHVSGVARWLTPTRPLIQLSLYGKANDRFWFTFFHEAAHILLHASTREDKKSVFLDDPNNGHVDDPAEHEANMWAGNWLIPPEYADELPMLTSRPAITAFASRIGIHPGIVLGRLQHDGLVPFATPLNGLKDRLQFKEAERD